MADPPYDSVPWLHVYGTDNGKHIMHIDRDTDEKIANARLIAAAPELLEALEKAQALVCGQLCDPVRPVSPHCQQCVNATAAIAKARGEA